MNLFNLYKTYFPNFVIFVLQIQEPVFWRIFRKPEHASKKRQILALAGGFDDNVGWKDDGLWRVFSCKEGIKAWSTTAYLLPFQNKDMEVLAVAEQGSCQFVLWVGARPIRQWGHRESKRGRFFSYAEFNEYIMNFSLTYEHKGVD